MPEKKRYIQIGTGGFGRYWCRSVYPRIADIAVPVAAADIDPEVHCNAIEFMGLPQEKCYTSAKQAIEENEADFAVIVVPPQFHEEMIDLALAKGMDILCEKPLADTMEGCVRIYNKVKAAGRKLAVTMSHRYEVEKQTVEAMVKSGSYGKLNYLVSRLTMARPEKIRNMERDPTAMLVGGLVHNLDTVRGVCGCNAKTVYADCWTFMADNISGGGSGLVQMTMENGVRAVLEESFANATTLDGWSNEYLRAECADATITASHKAVTLQNDRGYPAPVSAQMPLLPGPYWDHAKIARGFLNWVDGGPEWDTSLEDNLQCCAMVFACVESAKTGKAVDVQEFLKRYLAK